jgi:hypothetical protein
MQSGFILCGIDAKKDRAPADRLSFRKQSFLQNAGRLRLYIDGTVRVGASHELPIQWHRLAFSN